MIGAVALAVFIGSVAGVLLAVVLAALWGLLLGLVDLWRDYHHH